MTSCLSLGTCSLTSSCLASPRVFPRIRASVWARKFARRIWKKADSNWRREIETYGWTMELNSSHITCGHYLMVNSSWNGVVTLHRSNEITWDNLCSCGVGDIIVTSCSAILWTLLIPTEPLHSHTLLNNLQPYTPLNHVINCIWHNLVLGERN